MDPTTFVAPEVGRVVRLPGKYGFPHFEPAPMARELVLAPRTILALSEADAALGRLAGAGRLLPNPHLLIEPYLAREAVASSRIEGTQASLSDVLQAAAGGAEPGARTPDVAEVENYIRATRHGLERLGTLPLSLRLVREIHGVLMAGVRGVEKSPGEFRTTPNWIGSPNARPETAVFVPPADIDTMNHALRDWENFLNETPPIPPLIACALMHYQFETIHPFVDGNGRLGRLMIVFYLMQRNRLPQPLLYISAYLEVHRTEYYDHLQAVRERGELGPWFEFFLRGITVQANDAVWRAERLSDLRESYRRTLAEAGSRSRAVEVVDLMLANAFITAPRVSQVLGMTPQGAKNLINQLEAHGWLTSLKFRGPAGRRYWVAREIFEVVSGVDSAFS